MSAVTLNFDPMFVIALAGGPKTATRTRRTVAVTCIMRIESGKRTMPLTSMPLQKNLASYASHLIESAQQSRIGIIGNDDPNATSAL
eukprot:6177410-Pleurochrysis_carterae.AAC.1